MKSGSKEETECPAPGTKFCPQCRKEKPLTEFNKARKRKLGVQVYCRECQRARGRADYLRPERQRQIRVNDRRLADAVNQYVKAYLESHPCVDCHIADPLVLVFDHVRGKKEFDVSVARKRHHGLRALRAEIAKCDVRCANCHRRRHAAEGYAGPADEAGPG